MMKNPTLNFERFPDDGPLDETDVALRAYFASLADEHLAEFDTAWPDERVIEWDGNFRSDNALMLICCERDVDITEYRPVLAKHLECRKNIASREGS